MTSPRHAAVPLFVVALAAALAHAAAQTPPRAAAPAQARTTMPANGAQWKGAGLFGKGVLYAATEGTQYTVYAQRRDKDGTVEVHEDDSDIVIVMDGSATFVTGGTVADPRALRPHELTGSGVVGGAARQIGRGDAFIIPKGTPHWFKTVNGSVSYFAVKIHEPAAAAVEPAEALYWSRADAFAKGSLLYDGKDAHAYQLYAVQRDKPGIPELHPRETDIVFFLDGSATFVNGGALTGVRTLDGGEPREVGRDDLVIVPNAVQHWFQKVGPKVSYYAAKIRN